MHKYTLPNKWLPELVGEAEPTGPVKLWLDARPFLGPVARVGAERITSWHDAQDFLPGVQLCRDFEFAWSQK